MAKKKIEGITKLSVSGFKSIAEERAIDIYPLTILAGANSSGKSSIMQPLLMLKQTLEAPYDPGPLKIDGPNVQFTEAEQFMSTLVKENNMSHFHVQIETGISHSTYSTKIVFGKEKNGIEIIEMATAMKNPTDQKMAPHYTLYPNMSPEKIKEQTDQDSMLNELNELKGEDDFTVVKRSRCFLRLETKDGRGGLNLTSDVAFNIVRSIHLPGLRGNPSRSYQLTSAGPWYIGGFENYVASLIHEWQEITDKRLKTVAAALHRLKLTGHVRTKKIGDARIELQVGRLPIMRIDNPEMVNIADVGFGVSQVLPVIVALIAAEPGRLVYIEQPELHLHPNAQVALSQVLADAAKRGVRVVIETHSSLLLLGIQTLVAEGKLSPELVKLHWFSRTKEGVTKVNSKGLDKDGTYGKWPIDFDKVSLREQSRYIKASRTRNIEGT